MILTVTPNTGLDRVLFLPRLERGRRNQATGVRLGMGGKGCDVSLILRELGFESVATGLAAGDTGRRMEAMLRRAGVVADFVWTAGETRLNTVLIETESGAHTTICAPGLEPEPEAREALFAWIERWARTAEAVVLAGSLPEGWPPETYRELVRAARRQMPDDGAGASRRVPVVVDAAGAALEAALAEGADAVKPNREELEALCGPLPDLTSDSCGGILGPGGAAVLEAARALWSRGRVPSGRRVLVTLGGAGAILVSGAGAWAAPALPVPVVNPAGAGDGATACLALGEVLGWDEAETLRRAVAVSAAIVTTPGTAELSRAEAFRLLPAVRVERIA